MTFFFGERCQEDTVMLIMTHLLKSDQKQTLLVNLSALGNTKDTVFGKP